MSLIDRLHRRSRGDDSSPMPSFGHNFLTGLIQQGDDQADPSRVAEGYVHLSSLLNFCPRMFRLMAKVTEPLMTYPKSADRVMWAIGRALEHHVRTQVISSVTTRNVYGRWVCKCGETELEGRGTLAVCNVCKTPVNGFREIPVFDHGLRISGSPDLILVHGSKFRVVEIKSMNKTAFEALTAPVANHIFQVNGYVRMLEAAGHEVHDKAIIIYVMKDYAWKSPYKEFHVEKGALSSVLDSAFEQVRLFRQSESKGSMPPKLSACSSPDSTVAKKCPLMVRCWSCKNP
jgi:hypothetical protein